MKKVMLIILLMLSMMSVKATTIDCGEYKLYYSLKYFNFENDDHGIGYFEHEDSYYYEKPDVYPNYFLIESADRADHAPYVLKDKYGAYTIPAIGLPIHGFDGSSCPKVIYGLHRGKEDHMIADYNVDETSHYSIIDSFENNFFGDYEEDEDSYVLRYWYDSKYKDEANYRDAITLVCETSEPLAQCGQKEIQEIFIYKKVEETPTTIKPNPRIIATCNTANYEHISECGCMPAALTDLTSRLYMLIKIAAPALLLVVGGFDLIKAMKEQDESAINKARQKLIRKFIAAAAVFLIFTLVQFIVSTLANDSRTTMTCVNYLLNGYVA